MHSDEATIWERIVISMPLLPRLPRLSWIRLLTAVLALLIIVDVITACLKYVHTARLATNGKSEHVPLDIEKARMQQRLIPIEGEDTSIKLRVPTLPTSTPTSTPEPTALPAPVTQTPSPTVTSGNPSSWSLILSDNFTGTTLSPTWSAYDGSHTGGQSYYKPEEVQVANGMLHISIEQKNTNGLPYTSGGLAAFSLAQTYGKYEVRARLPLGKGIGPYAMLWPKNEAPNTAQVDIFESPSPIKSEVLFTNHGVDGTSSVLKATGSFAADFHTYTCEWTPGKLRFLVDGVEQGTITQSVFSQPMWFSMAISSGDILTGLPDSTTTLPVSMDVAWVHIYKYNG